jgi:hypothetical protein
MIAPEMRIHRPQITLANNLARIEARIETDRTADWLPESLWYEVPDRYANFLHDGYEGFIIALLNLAMQLREPIEVDGPISPQLAFHLPRFQTVNEHWHPRLFDEIEVHSAGYARPEARRPKGVGLAFSGGIDSAYALMRQLAPSEAIPAYQLSHAVFIKFDLPHHPKGNYELAKERFSPLLAGLGIDLLSVRTNQRFFVPDRKMVGFTRWMNLTHRAGTIGLGLVLSKGLGRFYLSSGRRFTAVSEDRLNLISDQWLSTEWFEMVNHGIRVSRAEKIAALAHWPPASAMIDVCWWNTHGVKNCGRCPKCVRTMTTFDAIGRLEHFTNFPSLRARDQIKWLWRNGEIHYTEESYRLAKAHGNRGLQRRLGLILAFGRPWIGLRKLLRRLSKPRD